MIQSTSESAKNLCYVETNIARLPTKTNLFSTYLYLELKSLFNTKTPINEELFGSHITFHSYANLAFLFREIFIDKDYYVALSNNAPTIIDCGANEGLSILFFKMIYPNANIIGFEPHPKSFAVLSKNIEHNNLQHVTLINKAVYNTEGPITFSSSNNLGSQILNNAKADESIIVQATLLSTYINAPVDLLKIDIEGAESAVIEELAQHKKLNFIQNIVMEFHAFAGNKYNNFAKTLYTLEENGFSYTIKKFGARYRIGIIHAYKN
jgi:FkbM family methyltransferase